ncbi:MAG: M23 family metallopeptidase [Solirubrobacteraceae bacterium]
MSGPGQPGRHRFCHALTGVKRAALRRVVVVLAAVMCVCAVSAAGAGRHSSLIAAAGMAIPAQAKTAAAGPGVAGIASVPKFSGLAASFLTRPSAVRGTDGRFHIAYELVLTNTLQFALGVQRVDVRDARTHRVLLSLVAGALSSRMNSIAGAAGAATPAAPTVLSPSGQAIVWLDVRVRRRPDLPRAMEHLVVSSSLPSPGTPSFQLSSLVGRVSLRTPAPVVLGPPVRGGIWVAAEGCCDENTHHRRGLLVVDGNEVVSQRFAIDWIKVDRHHRAWVGDPARLSSYFNYGQPLIAVADGTVVVARDGRPNQPPPNNPKPPSLEELPGNHVVLRIGPGIYVLYAHLVPGSVRVRVGQRVRRGQLLGRLGNSGNSATPHLHLQVQITRGFLSDGLPFVFDRFQLLGQITEPVSDENLGLRPNGQLPFAPARPSGTRRLEMPLDLNVVRFP